MLGAMCFIKKENGTVILILVEMYVGNIVIKSSKIRALLLAFPFFYLTALFALLPFDNINMLAHILCCP